MQNTWDYDNWMSVSTISSLLTAFPTTTEKNKSSHRLCCAKILGHMSTCPTDSKYLNKNSLWAPPRCQVGGWVKLSHHQVEWPIGLPLLIAHQFNTFRAWHETHKPKDQTNQVSLPHFWEGGRETRGLHPAKSIQSERTWVGESGH